MMIRAKRIRKMLIDKRDLLVGDIHHIEKELAENTDHDVLDEGDQSILESEKEMHFSLLLNDGKQLRKVDEAIERIKRGGYGYCKLCSRKIPLRRLQVVPFAEFCKDCQEEYEREMAEEELETDLSRLGTLPSGSDNDSFALARTAAKF